MKNNLVKKNVNKFYFYNTCFCFCKLGADKLLIARECHYRAQSWIKKSKVEDEKQKEKISLKISEVLKFISKKYELKK